MIKNSIKYRSLPLILYGNTQMCKLVQKKFISKSAIILLMFSLLSCDQVKNDWDTAVKEDKIEAYSLFLKKNPESKYKNNAIQKIDSLLFKKAVLSLKITNPKFVKLHPNKISNIVGQLNPNEMQDLISILVEKSNSPKASLRFIAPVSIPPGQDLTGKLHSSANGGITISGSTSSVSDDGKEYLLIINGILDGGYSNRSFLIDKGDFVSSNTPDKFNYKGSYTISSIGKRFLYSTFYPHDELYFTFHFMDIKSSRFMLPYGRNTVVRITGQLNNYFNGIAIKSDNAFPLHFVIKEKGLYYLMGKGEVKINNRKPIVFM